MTPHVASISSRGELLPGWVGGRRCVGRGGARVGGGGGGGEGSGSNRRRRGGSFVRPRPAKWQICAAPPARWHFWDEFEPKTARDCHLGTDSAPDCHLDPDTPNPSPRSDNPERFHPRSGNFGTKSDRKPQPDCHLGTDSARDCHLDPDTPDPSPRSGNPVQLRPRSGNFGTKSGRKPHEIATSASKPHRIATSTGERHKTATSCPARLRVRQVRRRRRLEPGLAPNLGRTQPRARRPGSHAHAPQSAIVGRPRILEAWNTAIVRSRS
jgi:hypothetical protein